MLYILTQMDKEKNRKIELFHQPQLSFHQALTGPDILRPTHQVVSTTIKLKRESIEIMARNSNISIPINLCFFDNYGVSIEIPIINLEIQETQNPNILTVIVTGLFPLAELYRIQPLTDSETSMGY